MFPIVVDLSRLPVLLIGNGAPAARRLRQLDEAGATRLAVFSESPSAALAAQAGQRLCRRLPDAGDFTGIGLVLIADLAPALVDRLAAAARAAGALVNVEDDIPHCDFHTPSMVRRGDLLIAVSTGGRSPTLAGRLRRFLEVLFPAEWAGHLDELAQARQGWRAQGLDMVTVARRSGELIAQRGWLPEAATVGARRSRRSARAGVPSSSLARGAANPNYESDLSATGAGGGKREPC
ncbi:MAG: siroheme synthase [Azospirillum sp.]|nr:siroheme synthase [Azospirillum sp.]